MSSTMERMIHEHEPSEGVLVWGGPHHGEVVPYDRATLAHGIIKFAHARRVSARDDPGPLFPSLSIQTVAYDVERWAVPWDDASAETWFGLIYQENKARLLDNFTGTAKTVMWMADPTRWTDD